MTTKAKTTIADWEWEEGFRKNLRAIKNGHYADNHIQKIISDTRDLLKANDTSWLKRVKISWMMTGDLIAGYLKGKLNNKQIKKVLSIILK